MSGGNLPAIAAPDWLTLRSKSVGMNQPTEGMASLHHLRTAIFERVQNKESMGEIMPSDMIHRVQDGYSLNATLIPGRKYIMQSVPRSTTPLRSFFVLLGPLLPASPPPDTKSFSTQTWEARVGLPRALWECYSSFKPAPGFGWTTRKPHQRPL